MSKKIFNKIKNLVIAEITISRELDLYISVHELVRQAIENIEEHCPEYENELECLSIEQIIADLICSGGVDNE